MAWRSHGTDNDSLVDALVRNRVLKTKKVIDAMRRVDRGNYCLPFSGESAYEDHPLPIGSNATISAPHMHAACLELVHDRIKENSRVLDVGSGSGYLTSCFAAMLDHHDTYAAGSIKGFEKKVGSRTDYRLVNRLHMGFRETKEEMVLQHCTTPDALDEWTRFKVKHEDDVNVKKKLFAIDPDFHELAISYTDKGVVSNGFYGLLLATELCEQVKVYGFFRKWKGNVYYHYYNSEAPNEGQSFRDDKEGDRLEMWLKERHMTHKMGEPCLQEDERGECKNCAPGLVCATNVWHPVPKPGYCYDEKHPETPANAKGLPRANCARKCDSVNDHCPGGKRGFCSKSVMESKECIFAD